MVILFSETDNFHVIRMNSPRNIEFFPTPYKIEAFCELDLKSQINALRVAKCIFVGDIAVGKTSLINRSNYGVFNNNYKATIGVDFDVQKYSILNLPFNLQIWDTAGQERFKCIASTYYRGSHVSVIVFDMSNVSTLASAKNWAQEISDTNQQSKPLLFLVGNKKELLAQSAFEFVEKEAIKVATELNAEYWSVSAQSGGNITELFNRISALTFQDMIWREIEDKAGQVNKVPSYSNFIKLSRDDSKKRKSCSSFSCP
ncbi:Ras-related protein Rab-34 [Halotydeus destructor]|nr:Ras-related protein Rab-34 [Halotydeus destructor]